MTALRVCMCEQVSILPTKYVDTSGECRCLCRVCGSLIIAKADVAFECSLDDGGEETVSEDHNCFPDELCNVVLVLVPMLVRC